MAAAALVAVLTGARPAPEPRVRGRLRGQLPLRHAARQGEKGRCERDRGSRNKSASDQQRGHTCHPRKRARNTSCQLDILGADMGALSLAKAEGDSEKINL